MPMPTCYRKLGELVCHKPVHPSDEAHADGDIHFQWMLTGEVKSWCECTLHDGPHNHIGQARVETEANKVIAYVGLFHVGA